MLENPLIQAAISALILSALTVGTLLLTLWSKKLSRIVESINILSEVTHNTNTKVDGVITTADKTEAKIDTTYVTAVKTETLVNSQRSELKAEIEILKARLDASQIAATVAAEIAARMAMVVAHENAAIAIQVALNTVDAQRLKSLPVIEPVVAVVAQSSDVLVPI